MTHQSVTERVFSYPKIELSICHFSFNSLLCVTCKVLCIWSSGERRAGGCMGRDQGQLWLWHTVCRQLCAKTTQPGGNNTNTRLAVYRALPVVGQHILIRPSGFLQHTAAQPHCFGMQVWPCEMLLMVGSNLPEIHSSYLIQKT